MPTAVPGPMTVSPPLAGLRVLELARVLAGPWAGQLLADLGAEVIKVESLDGDDTRGWGPPFVDNADGSRDAAYFHRLQPRQALDRRRLPHRRRAAASSASSPAGADVAHREFQGRRPRPSTASTTRAWARSIRALVYCSITGFGQDGPYAAAPATTSSSRAWAASWT